MNIIEQQNLYVSEYLKDVKRTGNWIEQFYEIARTNGMKDLEKIEYLKRLSPGGQRLRDFKIYDMKSDKSLKSMDTFKEEEWSEYIELNYGI